MGRRNKSTFIPTETRVKARRIRKVMEAILTNPPDCDEVRKEMEADLKLLKSLFPNHDIEFVDVLGDNHSFELLYKASDFKALEVKYIKAPKEALKGL